MINAIYKDLVHNVFIIWLLILENINDDLWLKKQDLMEKDNLS